MGLHLDKLPVTAGSPLDGRQVGDIELRGNRGFLIVASAAPTAASSSIRPASGRSAPVTR
jgi:hypothetical protein